MSDSFYLAWQYLRHHRLTTVVLVMALTLILYLPVGLQLIVQSAEQHFRSRAESTPLVIGPKGSPLELVLGSLYFDQPTDEIMRYQEFRRVNDQNVGTVIPLHTRFTARETRILGTTADYLNFRRIPLAEGAFWTILGECVVGANAAKRLSLGIGDRIAVSSASEFLLDSPPLRLRVTGILKSMETPDDDVIFVHLKTAWILEGLGHGHTPGTRHGSEQAGLFTDITPENLSSFHFHGSRDRFPITAAIVLPDTRKEETILQGQYFSPEETVQIVRPREVMDALLSKVLMIRSYLVTVISIVSTVTLLTMGLVIVLSIRLRRAEIVTMSKMGCSRYRIASLLACQIVLILAMSLLLAASLAIATYAYGTSLVRALIL